MFRGLPGRLLVDVATLTAMVGYPPEGWPAGRLSSSERTISMRFFVPSVLGCSLWCILCSRYDLPSPLLWGGAGVIAIVSCTVRIASDAAQRRAFEKLGSKLESEERRPNDYAQAAQYFALANQLLAEGKYQEAEQACAKGQWIIENECKGDEMFRGFTWPSAGGWPSRHDGMPQSGP
jgi:hypothetical protein